MIISFKDAHKVYIDQSIRDFQLDFARAIAPLIEEFKLARKLFPPKNENETSVHTDCSIMYDIMMGKLKFHGFEEFSPGIKMNWNVES